MKSDKLEQVLMQSRPTAQVSILVVDTNNGRLLTMASLQNLTILTSDNTMGKGGDSSTGESSQAN